MTPQPTLLDEIAEAERLKHEGMALVDSHQDQRWRAEVDAAIASLARRGEPFTSEDVRALVATEPTHPNAWGPRFVAAANAGVIEFLGYVKSSRPSLRRARVAQWRGRG